MNSQKEQSDKLAEPKRPYQRPQLQIYGDLGTITRGLGNMGNYDNPLRPNEGKTGF